MKQSEEQAALLALLLSKQVRWRDAAERVLDSAGATHVLRDAFGDQDTLFDVDQGPMEVALAEARQLLSRCASDGVGVHAFRDDSYPTRLRDVHEMPPLIFTRGTVLAEEQRSIAVVGSRKASEHGLAVAGSIARRLTQENITVVSGLAAGIDTVAHRTALDHGGRTVAVLGTGINRFHPSENRRLQDEIADKGLLISQFLPDAAPTKKSFPMRNAVMSGYAAATVVVEAGEHSGARIRARMALEHGRPVILPRESLRNQWVRDYEKRPGVHLVSDIEELMRAVRAIMADAEVKPEELVGEAELVW